MNKKKQNLSARWKALEARLAEEKRLEETRLAEQRRKKYRWLTELRYNREWYE